MVFDIKKFVGNAHDRRFSELYERINKLVNTAGQVTIAELFTKSREELGAEVWEAIQNAKQVGFLRIRNNSCCRSGKCQASNRGWCSNTSDGTCAAASDTCESAGQRLRNVEQTRVFPHGSSRLVER